MSTKNHSVDFERLYRKWRRGSGHLTLRKRADLNRPKEGECIDSEVETGRAVSQLPVIPTDSGFTNYGRFKG